MALQYKESKDIKCLSIAVKDRYLQPTDKNIKNLMKSLTDVGQLQPISVSPITMNSYRLIAGATRLEAALNLGWKTIRAQICYCDHPNEFKIAELAENLDRKDLSGAQRVAMRKKREEYQREMVEAAKKVVAPSSKGGRGKKGGERAATEQAGVPRSTYKDRERKAKLVGNSGSRPVYEEKNPTEKESESHTPATRSAPMDQEAFGKPSSTQKFKTHCVNVRFIEQEVINLDKYIKAGKLPHRGETVRMMTREYMKEHPLKEQP